MSRGRDDLRNGADRSSVLLERNFAGLGGDDGSDPSIEIESDTDALYNLFRIRNNVVAGAHGGGIEVDGDGAWPQLINNTIAFSGENGEAGIEQSGGFNGFDQTFVLNCITSHNARDLDRANGMSAFYSFIGDEPVPVGLGNLGGDPFYAKDLRDLPHSFDSTDLFDMLTLAPASAAIDAGHPAARFNDPDGTRNDMGACGGPRAGPVGFVGAGAPTPFVYVGTAPAVNLYTGAVLPADTTTLHFGFSRPVNAATMAAGIAISNGGVAVPGTFSTLAAGHVVRFVPTGTLTPGVGTFVDVAFSAALQDTNGQALAVADRVRFSVVPAETVEAEPNDDGVAGVTPADLAAAQAIGGPAPFAFNIGATLAAPGDVDVFSFSATAGDRLKATTLDARLGGMVGDCRIDLYDAAGNLIDIGRHNLWNQDGIAPNGDAYVDHVFTTGGTYYLVVTQTDGFYRVHGVLDN